MSSLPHAHLDARSLALHQRVAQLLREEPALFDRAQATLSHWLDTVDPATRPYLLEWQAAMEHGMERALALAVEDSPRAAALRQASPFAGLLPHEERFELLRAWRRKAAHASA